MTHNPGKLAIKISNKFYQDVFEIQYFNIYSLVWQVAAGRTFSALVDGLKEVAVQQVSAALHYTLPALPLF